jgi:succinate dehydrogenase / fumarate reductase membrane anchor subunit
MSQSIRTPLGKVRGHGAAGSGTGHFIGQRVSAILLALLAPYLVISAALGLGPGYDGAVYWASTPWVAPVLLLFILAGLYHMQIGMQVVIEDYLAKPATRATASVLNVLLAIVLAVVAAFALFSLFLKG